MTLFGITVASKATRFRTVDSKRSDPRMGDQTFQLTNIVRTEPDPSLFAVPSDFMILDTPGPIVYKTSGGPAQ